jgi:hypothetical protein
MCVFSIPLLTSGISVVSGVPGAVSATESDASSVQEGAQLYENDQAAEVPGGIRSGEGH